ncbi:MAG: hypothetical protein LBK75_08375 [Oscillospiraceae bacterium]|nr:hypothetical protein [Oscillospiraceae bacterium]
MRRRILSCVLVASLLLSLFVGVMPAAGAAPAGGGAVIEYFKNPDANSKPMARMWFPDAEAGADDHDLIEKQILELAAKGFGGVEVAMLADGVSYDNAAGAVYGWGTDNWSKLLKKVLKAAAKVPGGFQIDMTITAHWPPALDTLDPNDDAANEELSYSFTKITDGILQGGTVDLSLPTQKISLPAGGFGGGGATTNFLFTDTFVAAAAAKVVGINSGKYVLDFDSLTPIAAVSQKMGGDGPGGAAGFAAGVPDAATAAAKGWNYQTNVVNFFGPDPAEPLPDGMKLDAQRNRKRMADWQYEYKADLSGLTLGDTLNDDTTIQPGDWVVVSIFYRGTGQSISGGKIMHNGAFVTNYYNQAGTQAVTGYWDDMFARDPELLDLMKANPGYIFEDSIESSSAESYWAPSVLDDVEDEYAYKNILPIVAASRYMAGMFGTKTRSDFFLFDDDVLAGRIYEDYNDKLAGLYVDYRVNGVLKWARDTAGWGFRGQTYHLPGLEIASAAMVADVAECDNMSKGDGVRYQSGTVNVTGRDYLTMEAMTGLTVNLASMGDIRTEIGQNYSDGVSRAILHGTPYAKTFNGYNAGWPGWLPFGAGSFGDAYTYRQAYWDDITTETDYMARNQAIIQKGQAQIDLAVLIDKEKTYDFESGNRFQNLLDLGYSYNPISESILSHPNATVSGGRLAPDGPAFKALVVDRVSILSVDGIDKLIEYAVADLPIVVYNSNIARVYGSDVADDAVLADKFNTLLALPGVKKADTLNAVRDALKELNITPYADYSAPQLETTMYTDPADGTNYYYMYNNALPTNSGMMSNGAGKKYKGGDKAIRNVAVTLAGDGVPYQLDAITGEIRQVGEYTIGNGTVAFVIDELYGGDSVIYAVTTNATDFPAAKTYVKSVDKPSEQYSIARSGGGLTLRSNTPAAYTVRLSDNATKNVTVAKTLGALDLSDAKWDLVIKSYGPTDDGNDPSESKITTVDFGKQNLIDWENIAASDAQLAQLGVNHMRYVSGIGEYTLTFDAPSDWNATTGAYLDVTYGWDQIGSVTVNGYTFPANNASDRLDIGGALVPGANTIAIKLSTTLFARTFLENSGYADNNGTVEPAVSGGFGGGGATPYMNGLRTVKLTPYTQILLETAVGVRTSARTPFGGKAEYTFSAQDMETVNLIELTFTVDGNLLSGAAAALEGLNGFTVFDALTWKDLGNNQWQGKVILGIIGNNQTKSGVADVAKLQLDTVKLGDAAVTLTDVKIYGIDIVDGVAVSHTRSGKIAPASAVAKITSVYDANGDDKVDLADLSLAFYYYQSRQGDANWESAKVTDVNGDNVVDMLDLVEIYAHFIA